MSQDQFTHVTKTGYGSRIVNSLKGILLGAALFIASFGVLYWNEGRADLSLLANTAVQMKATETRPDAEGKLVSISAQVFTDELLGDDLYFKPGNYIGFDRTVEMYSWVEHSETETEQNLGGSETETTTITYQQEWTEKPEESKYFKHAQDHENPSKTIESESFRVNSARLGLYSLDIRNIGLPSYEELSLVSEIVLLPEPESEDDPKIELSSHYIFNGQGALDNPEIGDMRISYSALRDGSQVTVFGKLDDTKIKLFESKNGELLRMFHGNHAEAVAQMATEHKVTTWILRLVGFLMMWFGLGMLIGPINVLLDVIPALGKLSRFAIGAATFLIALVLSVVTILVSMVFHNTVAMIITAVIILVAIFFWIKRKLTKKSPPGETPPPPAPPTPPPATPTTPPPAQPTPPTPNPSETYQANKEL